jgi:hypothetical protein
MFKKLICKMFGHSPRYAEGRRGMAGPWVCTRCAHHGPGVVWPRGRVLEAAQLDAFADRLERKGAIYAEVVQVFRADAKKLRE